MESVEKKTELFKSPDIFAEVGEFDRVAETFGVETSVLTYAASHEGQMVTLSDEVWEKLENTDSNRFKKGDWDQVEEHANAVDRDWQDLKAKLENGRPVYAPVIMKFGDRYHKVSGNTRLMVCRAMGIKPKVLMFEIDLKT